MKARLNAKMCNSLIAVLAAVKNGKISGEDVVGSVIAVSKVAEEQMGGTSGALYS